MQWSPQGRLIMYTNVHGFGVQARTSPEPLSMGDKAEELPQTELLVEEV